MVAHLIAAVVLAQQAAEPVIERLDPPRRAAVIMALLGIVLVGLFLVTIALLGGNWARRQARQRPEARGNEAGSCADGRDRPLRETSRPILPSAKGGETIQGGSSTPDTRTDS